MKATARLIAIILVGAGLWFAGMNDAVEGAKTNIETRNAALAEVVALEEATR
jgi:hypothetical protein